VEAMVGTEVVGKEWGENRAYLACFRPLEIIEFNLYYTNALVTSLLSGSRVLYDSIPFSSWNNSLPLRCIRLAALQDAKLITFQS
jgi:hypothetical protein